MRHICDMTLFSDFRAAARSTPEAELARQLAEAQEAVKAAEARAAKAAKAKQGYKEQVRSRRVILQFRCLHSPGQARPDEVGQGQVTSLHAGAILGHVGWLVTLMLCYDSIVA